MRRFFRKLLNKYYDRLISNHQETWRGEYYKYLKNFATGDNWKKTVKPRFKKKLAAHIKREGKGKFAKKWLYIKFRIQMILFGLRDDEFFSMRYYDKPLLFSRKSMTKARIYWMDRYLNDYTYIRCIGNKATFAKLLGEELFGRKWLEGPCSYEAFEKTFGSCDKIMVKPLYEYGGKDIKIYDLTEGNMENVLEEINEAYSQAYTEGFIIEEYFKQQGFMHELNESSLNTIRVITIRRPGTQEVFVLDSFLRVGMPGAIVDNYSSGGATYDLDINTGTIGTVGAKSINAGKHPERHPHNHPGTDKCYTGLVIPHWDKILKTCEETHTLIHEGLNFIGWDVCLSDDKITFIEANGLAGFGRQYKGKRDKKWQIIEEILDSAKKK